MRILLGLAVLASLATTGLSIPECDGIWTPFYDRDDPSVTGDHETLHDLRKKHDICAKPTGVDARLVKPLLGGKDYWYLGGNYIDENQFKPSVGFICLNALQKKHYKPPCKDYKVRFCCPKPPPPKCYGDNQWTPWLDRDDPSATGDWETLADFLKQKPPKGCTKPSAIDAALVSNGHPYYTGGDNVFISPTFGLKCVNKEQKDHRCHDYKVRFCCPKPLPKPTCTGNNYWTQWLDRDDPSVTGDWETLADFLKEQPYSVCKKPSAIDATVKGTHNPYYTTGEHVTIGPSFGFKCLNKDQIDKKCHDYQVRFCCPKHPPPKCHGKWTEWLDRDDPSATGDWETLADFQKMKPPKGCPKPYSIDAALVSNGHPYYTGGDKVFISPTFGLKCVNKEQKDHRCHDYKVRFCCPARKWTVWYDVDDPSGTGDHETIDNLRKNHKYVCKHPYAIEVQTLGGVDAHRTGQVFKVKDKNVGFICLNAMQKFNPKTYRREHCHDYKVRFLC